MNRLYSPNEEGTGLCSITFGVQYMSLEEWNLP